MNRARRYASRTVDELLEAFASGVPLPGGGSAAALTGAVGVALLLKVAGLRMPPGALEAAALTEAAERLHPLWRDLGALIDRDHDAYASVLDARRLLKDSDAQTTVRRHAVDSAMRSATEAPLDVLRACRQALAEAPLVAEEGPRRATSDVGVAIKLLRAGAQSAAMSVDANLAALEDITYVERVRAERRRLEEESDLDAGRGEAILERRLTAR